MGGCREKKTYFSLWGRNCNIFLVGMTGISEQEQEHPLASKGCAVGDEVKVLTVGLHQRRHMSVAPAWALFLFALVNF